MRWPPELPDHDIIVPWSRVTDAKLEELRADAKLGPCEAVECIARSKETGKHEFITSLRPLRRTA